VVAVVVPRGGECPHRERAWQFVRERYASAHPGWEVREARAPAEEWCKARAINPAVEATSAEIVIQADCDVWTDGLDAAVDAVRDGAPWAIPHIFVHRLDEAGTAAVLEGADWRRQPLACPEGRPYRGIAGGGVLVALRETLRAVPLDPRFVFWGQEDESHAMALSTLYGEPWRGSADLLHLWHPPQDRYTRRRGSTEGWALRGRYSAAREDPAAMAALIEEGHGAH
jgi:hypothetical protein